VAATWPTHSRFATGHPNPGAASVFNERHEILPRHVRRGAAVTSTGGGRRGGGGEPLGGEVGERDAGPTEAPPSSRAVIDPCGVDARRSVNLSIRAQRECLRVASSEARLGDPRVAGSAGAA
jgi:hypothetical protein